MKSLSAALSALALSFTLLLVPGTAATAAPAAPAVYPGSVKTTCTVAVPRKIRKKHRLRVTYRVRAGNAKPRGNVMFRVYKFKRGSYVLVRRPVVYYPGGKRTFKFAKLNRGKYKVNYRYNPFANSVYKPCASPTRTFRVTR